MRKNCSICLKDDIVKSKLKKSLFIDLIYLINSFSDYNLFDNLIDINVDIGNSNCY